MNTLDIAVKTGEWHLHPVLNIHDDLTVVVPETSSILEKAIEDIYTTMLSPTYKFVNVPLSVKCSVGHNWFEMEEIGQFRSNRDL